MNERDRTQDVSDIYAIHAAFDVAMRRFRRSSDRQARLAGLTPQQYRLLLIVRGHLAYPRVSIGEIAHSLDISGTSASQLVDRAVRRGLLVRHDDPDDRRRVMVHPTERGMRALESLVQRDRLELGANGQSALEHLCESLRASASPPPQS